MALDLLGRGPTAWLLEKRPLDPAEPLYYAFNRSLLSHRMEDALTLLALMRHNYGVKHPALIGLGMGAVIALLARPLAGDLGATAADLRGCRVEDDSFWLGEAYHPLIRKIGDLRGAFLLGPPSPLLLSHPGPSLLRWSKTLSRLDRRAAVRSVPGALSPEDIVRLLGVHNPGRGRKR